MSASSSSNATHAGMTVIEKGTCGFHSYSPISTLERQYNGYASSQQQQQRWYMFVQANANACLLGGVESVLKIRQSNSSSNTMNSASPSLNTTLDPSEYILQNHTIDNAQQGGADNDPFSFLGQDNNTGTSTATATAASITSGGGGGTPSSSRGPNIGRFLKKVAHTTTQTLERGMTNLAIRADGGKSPDLLVLGLYDESSSSSIPNNTSILLGMTESKPLPDSQQRLNGVRFQIPLVLSPSSSSGNTGEEKDNNVCIKLWIRSGAALLQGTKAAKNYLLGSALVPVSQLRQSLMNASRCCFITLDLQSSLVVNGKLQVCIVPDLKFPRVCTRGWTLSDPEMSSSSACYHHHGGMFNLPLDQSYGFPFPSSSSSSNMMSTTTTCVASERAIESTVVLPVATAFMQLAARASQISMAHATSVASRVYAARHDSFVGEYADCNVRIGSLKVVSSSPGDMTDASSMAAGAGGGIFSSSSVPTSAFVSVSWQRPDSIFEVDLLNPTRVPTSPLTNNSAPPTSTSDFIPSMNVRFYPKPVRERILPAILQACGGQLPPTTGFLLGNLRLLIAIPRPSIGVASNSLNIHADNPFGHFGTGTQALAAAEDEHWECVIGLEGLLIQPPPTNGVPPVLEYPVFHTTSGRQMGNLVVQIDLKLLQGQPVPPKAVSAHGGLVSLVGLQPLCDGINPDLDYDMTLQHQQPQTDQRRQQQLSTMGAFVTHAYMDQHVRTTRTADCNELNERATRYRAALTAPAVPPEQRLPPHEDRTPKPFRPSSSRSDRLLSGIPFNVHTATLSLNVMNPETTTTTTEPQGDVFYNITCGAPSDHARGFSSVFPSNMPPNVGLNSPVGVVSGGLRRLEAKRAETAKVVSDMQTMLIMQVANFFVMARQNQKYINHVPGSNAELQELRWKLFEATQSLHHLTWICATRRANCFSQALGLAVTSYLASMSDPAKLQSSWPSWWAQHGYLVSFEGLLSAAGKELGMIEDASVGIDMLRMVKAIFVPDNGSSDAEKVPVVASPFLKWIRLTPTFGPPGTMTDFTLELGIVPSYYEQRIPSVLKNGTAVRFYSLLFEVGVDIRQFGAHAGSNMTKQLKQRVTGSEVSQQQSPPSAPSSTGSDGAPVAGSGGLLDDEDDDVGVTDDDVLVQLNYEAFQKLNAYAHLIFPANSAQSNQKIHPLLDTLYQHIASSSGTMNHDILDEAALLSQQLGGGGIVFCKSGKDRTAMHWTFKASKFATAFRQRGHSAVAMGQQQQPTPTSLTSDATLEDAMMLRVYGTRLPICEKNVGQTKYAFNSLQVKFMPDALKPPMNTLAGFLKGGKVFSGGGIES